MSTAVNNNRLLGSTVPNYQGDVSSGAGQSYTVSGQASFSASTAFSVSAFQGSQGIMEGGCFPQLPPPQPQAPSCPQPAGGQNQIMQLMMSVIQMVLSLLQSIMGQQQQPQCPPGQSPGSPQLPSGPSCPGTPGSPQFPQAPSCPSPQLPSFPSSPSCPSPQIPSGPSCPPSPPQCGPSGKTWDVFFDSKEGTKTQQRSPIILDLNGNGKADITGSNIKGNGKLEGKTVKGFDLDPTKRQWEFKSIQRRPSDGAPALPKGTKMQVFDANGRLVAEKSAAELSAKGKKDKSYGLSAGQRAEFRDENGRLVGELKKDEKSGKTMYHWGNKNENEWTKPWDSATGGDGILAWDIDNDGQITSSKELFGEFDVNGQKSFKNGYEKLAKHFDKDGNGVVEGAELNGLKIWEDRNGDGITQKGEMVELADRGVRSLNVNFDSNDMSSSYGKYGNR